MSVSRLNEQTLRPAEHFLAWAFGISLGIHVLLYGGFNLGNHYGWWKKDLMPSWLKSTKQALAEIKKAQQKQPVNQAQQEPPMLFVEVDPAVATQEAPKNATHYSSHNSHAGNPDITIDSNDPNINGKQTHVAKTQDADRSKPVPLRPSPPKTPPSPDESAQEAKAKPNGGPKPGDLAMAKPAQQPGDVQINPDTGEAKAPTHKRPHTLLEALQQQPSAAIPGQKMKQEGGVQHHLDSSAYDAIATPFGEYDRELIDAITTHWWSLLDRKEFSQDHTGRVIVQFTLRSDGRVTDIHVVHSDVGDLLASVCELAITDPAPYAPWPGDMRRYYAKDSLDITFTFWYE
ncbi:MAG TPA: energy transducer TonB [Verrucomicrobiae bacterium]|nr:energy transducer TonB [Verrucomicrobiae bacterium]